ncbi:MAG: hypothetical protein HWE10_09020 [Gammaproteobacteria bacterium]|nr:hypothetical protein [Gammaproteobacteria bacterium]
MSPLKIIFLSVSLMFLSGCPLNTVNVEVDTPNHELNANIQLEISQYYKLNQNYNYVELSDLDINIDELQTYGAALCWCDPQYYKTGITIGDDVITRRISNDNLNLLDEIIIEVERFGEHAKTYSNFPKSTLPTANLSKHTDANTLTIFTAEVQHQEFELNRVYVEVLTDKSEHRFSQVYGVDIVELDNALFEIILPSDYAATVSNYNCADECEAYVTFTWTSEKGEISPEYKGGSLQFQYTARHQIPL